jgi:hypothetical protein
MAKALFGQLELLTKKDEDPSAIEEELAKDIETLPKVAGLTSIGLESAASFPS